MKYTLTVTEEQARMIARACEIYARLGMGQAEDALRMLPWDKDRTGNIVSASIVIATAIRRQLITPYLGITNEAVKPECKRAWDTYQVIRHKLSWDRAVAEGHVESDASPRNWKEMMAVCFDSPLSVAREPLPKIKPADGPNPETGDD